MSLHRWAFALALLLLADATMTAAQTLPPSTEYRAVVLKNGRLLRGTVTRDGDDYVVAVNAESHVRLRAEVVDFACRDLQHAYQMKRVSINATRAGDHIVLAEWCLQHGLRNEAADHILHASSIEPFNKRLIPIERRWRMLNQVATTKRPDAPNPTTRLSKNDIDEQLAALPKEVMQQFTTTIQPILLNNCGTSGCHGKNTTGEFRLSRPNWGPGLARGSTQRNLHSVVTLVDRDSPSSSRLLMTATNPHAKLPEAIFDDKASTQLQLLTSWVNRVAGAAEPLPNKIVDREPILSQAKSGSVRPVSDETEIGDDASETTTPARVVDEPQTLGLQQIPQPLPPLSPARSSDEQAFKPRDPFDAEIFNRRYGPRAAEQR